MEAMEFDYTERVIFSPVPIPEEVVEGLRGEFGGRLRTDIELDVPPNYNDRPPGTEAPELVLCVSRTNPNHYKVFKFARDIDRRDYEVAGRTWGRLVNEEQWRKFLRLSREMDEMVRNATGVEPPEDLFDDVKDLAPSEGAI